jgi:uncharacterized coiled-coil DUF342 family protein
MQKTYLSSEKRLAEYFEKSRDKWRSRSLKYQSEKRELLLKLRDTIRSREKWKNELAELKEQLIECKKKHQNIKELTQLIMEK